MKGLQIFQNKVLKKDIHYVTSDFKTRNDARPTHSGIDLVSYNGKRTCTDYIVAVYDGKVVTSSYNATGAGYYVEILHPSGIKSRYLHMKKGSIKVKKGDIVKTGQEIGYMGNTGNSKGAHLHFGIVKDKKNVDPLPYLNDAELFKEKEPAPEIYIVKGDTIQDVSKQTGVSVDKICEANNIVDFRIYVGQELIIPRETYEDGNYKILVSKTLRKTTSLVTTNRVKVKECDSETKKLLTSKKANDIAMFKLNVTVPLEKVVTKDGRKWMQYKNYYIVVENKDGTKQVERV